MFGGNTLPKRFAAGSSGFKKEPKKWYCDECDRENEAYWSICPSCGGVKPRKE